MPGFLPNAAAKRSVSSRRRILVALLLLAMLGWSSRESLLFAAGDLLVREDPVEPVDAIVVSVASPAADALEAVRLYRQGIAPQVVLCTFASGPVDDEIRRLGVPRARPSELAKMILERSGVPSAAIVVLPDRVDGTNTEVAAVAAFARRHRLASLLLIVPRSHTARARWLLRQAAPRQTRIVVRGPRNDRFTPDAWWRHRGQSREALAEYLRWANTLLLRDRWSASPVVGD